MANEFDLNVIVVVLDSLRQNHVWILLPPPRNRRLEDYVTRDYYSNYVGSRSYADLVTQFLANIDD